jgi:acetyl esterase
MPPPRRRGLPRSARTVDPAGRSDIAQRLASALRHLIDVRTDLSTDTLSVVRESVDRRRRELVDALDTVDVDVVDDGAPSNSSPTRHTVPVRIYRGGVSPAPAVIYCHSGAFVLGNLDTDHRQCVEFARRGRCTVISVDYRLAPEHPYPAALDDVMTVLTWARINAKRLGIDAQRVAVAGNSAGGALAALAAQSATATTPIALQVLHQPVLDDRSTPSKKEFLATPGLDGPAVAQMWHHYLVGRPVPPGAVPARTLDLAGAASALITCSELDPLRDEAIFYAQRLMWAGVATQLHVIPGTCHGFDSLAPEWATSQSLFALQGQALLRALHPEASGSVAPS